MNLNYISTEYTILKNVVERIKEVDKIENLFPPQADAIKSGYLEGNNLVLSIPTSAGKTLVSELSMLKVILEKGKKAIYLVPLKALATEKLKEFKEKYEPLGIKVAISIGDYDKADNWLSNFDIIVTSNEKCDSLLRHGSSFFHNVGIIIVDEVHMLNDVSRGPTLEVVLTRLKDMTNAQILALSATIKNSSEIAEWLNAELIESDFRPVKLHKGVCYNKKLDFGSEKIMRLNSNDSDSLFELVEKTLERGKQILVFVGTRKGSESVAERIGKHIEKRLKPEERKKLFELSKSILKSLDSHTKQCERLASCIKTGTAFHHAGEVSQQRELIENFFREGLIKVITATPTLSFGLNLPANTVIIRDLKRFSSFRGMDYLPVLEVHQMCGRAGRYKYDTEGFAILLPKNRGEAEYAWDNYMMGEPEKIYSKLGVEPVLRMHVLSLIASGITPTKQALLDFFSKTFYAHQYKDLTGLNLILERIINLLENFNFIATSENKKENKNPFRKASKIAQDCKLYPTKIGRRVSELYIDPLTAHKLIQNATAGRPLAIFNILQSISNTIEMKPLPGLRKSDFRLVDELIVAESDNLLEPVPNAWDLEYDDFLCSIKTAAMFQSWCSESGENELLENYGITPGELRARLERADWLLYAFQELALLLGQMDSIKDIRKARLRIKYGIREELLPLVRLKGVGRARARLLHNSGLKKLSDLRKIPLESLEKIMGHAIAVDIKDQLGELEEE